MKLCIGSCINRYRISRRALRFSGLAAGLSFVARIILFVIALALILAIAVAWLV